MLELISMDESQPVNKPSAGEVRSTLTSIFEKPRPNLEEKLQIREAAEQ